jgi:hypothetical protein
MIVSFRLFESLLEDKSYVELYKKYFSDYKSLDGVQMSDELGERILDSDPTENKEYKQWLFTMFKKYDFSEYESELNTVKELLRIYNIGKNRLPRDNEFKNIANVKTFDNLREVVRYIEENELHISKKERLKEKRAKSKIAVHDEYIEIHDDPEWKIIIPLSHPQSKFWADGANWCTASASNDMGHFETYSSDSPLYIFHNKSNSQLNHQLFLGVTKGKEFKNYRNEEVSLLNFLQKYPDLAESLMEFWSTGNKVLKNSLGTFLSRYLEKPEENFSVVADLLFQGNTFLNLKDIDLEKILIGSFKRLNFEVIKKILEKNPELVNKVLPNGMTPLMSTIKFKSPANTPEQDDMMTLEVCKYLIKMGADGSGVTESSKSNVLLEALHEKKYKTLMLIKDLPNYDRNPSSEIEMKNKSAFYLSTIQLTPEGSDDTLSYKDFSDLTASFITHGMELDGFMQGPRMFNPIVLIILRYMIEKNESIIEMIRVFLENGASPCVSLENFEEMKVPKENIPDIMTLLLEYKEKTKCE